MRFARFNADLRQQFPGATITASNMSDIANAVSPYRDQFPVVTDEIGDTWIYGVPSDPVKVARYREMARLRREWIADGHLALGDATDIAFLRRFSLCAEHTWGTDTRRTWITITISRAIWNSCWKNPAIRK